MKRALAYLFSLLLGVSLVFSTTHAENQPSLQFDSNGEFRILIIADPQDTDTPQPAMLALLDGCIEESHPDLVVFLGDMIHGKSIRGKERVSKAIDAIIRPVINRGIPFALVFGNHDSQCGLANEEQLIIYQSYPGCMAIKGEEMPGCGNYYLLIDNPVYPESPLVLWFFDSGTYAEQGRGTYGYVTKEQNEWMLKAEHELLKTYQSPVSYVFQHIPVPQVYNMLKQVDFGTKGAVTCYGPNFLKWYIADPSYIWDGDLGEAPCSSEYDSGEFDVWKS